jgi:hypothetical protein
MYSCAVGRGLGRCLCIASFGAEYRGKGRAIGRCIRVAHLQYHNEEQQIQRADVYKACMVAAGYQP